MNYIDFGCAMCVYPIYIYVCLYLSDIPGTLSSIVGLTMFSRKIQLINFSKFDKSI